MSFLGKCSLRRAQGTDLFLDKQCQAMEGGLVTCRSLGFCNPGKIHGRIFFTGMFFPFLPISKERMEARVRGPEICKANLRSSGKSKDGFSLQACFSLSCQAMPSHGGRVSNMQKPLASAIPKKIQGGIFLGHTPDWKGGLAGHRNEVRRLERKRNPGKRVTKGMGGRISRGIGW